MSEVKIVSLAVCQLWISCTLEPRYNAPRYNAILDTTLIFHGSQIIFQKDLWGLVDVNSLILAHIGASNFLIYINILTF